MAVAWKKPGAESYANATPSKAARLIIFTHEGLTAADGQRFLQKYSSRIGAVIVDEAQQVIDSANEDFRAESWRNLVMSTRLPGACLMLCSGGFPPAILRALTTGILWPWILHYGAFTAETGDIIYPAGIDFTLSPRLVFSVQAPVKFFDEYMQNMISLLDSFFTPERYARGDTFMVSLCPDYNTSSSKMTEMLSFFADFRADGYECETYLRRLVCISL